MSQFFSGAMIDGDLVIIRNAGNLFIHVCLLVFKRIFLSYLTPFLSVKNVSRAAKNNIPVDNDTQAVKTPVFDDKYNCALFMSCHIFIISFSTCEIKTTFGNRDLQQMLSNAVISRYSRVLQTSYDT